MITKVAAGASLVRRVACSWSAPFGTSGEAGARPPVRGAGGGRTAGGPTKAGPMARGRRIHAAGGAALPMRAALRPFVAIAFLLFLAAAAATALG
jgi:hypothetical protein